MSSGMAARTCIRPKPLREASATIPPMSMMPLMPMRESVKTFSNSQKIIRDKILPNTQTSISSSPNSGRNHEEPFEPEAPARESDSLAGAFRSCAICLCPERAKQLSPGQRPGLAGPHASPRPERAKQLSPGQRPGLSDPQASLRPERAKLCGLKMRCTVLGAEDQVDQVSCQGLGHDGGPLFCPLRANDSLAINLPRALPWAKLLRPFQGKGKERNFKKRYGGNAHALAGAL